LPPTPQASSHERAIVADDGVELAVTCWGEPHSTPIVALHGFSLDYSTWSPIVDGLVSSGYYVVAPDLRGHGRSELGTGLTLERFARDVVEIVEQLELNDVHLVGHSLGGVFALAARANQGAGPGRLATVTAVAATERAIQNPIMKLGARLFSSPFGVRSLQRRRTGRLLIRSWFGKQPRDEDLDWIRLLSASCSQTTRAAIVSATEDLDLRPSFSLAGPPTHIVCGERDRATPLSVSKRITAAIEGAKMSTIPGAGHMVMVEEPEEVVAALTSFFDER